MNSVALNQYTKLTNNFKKLASKKVLEKIDENETSKKDESTSKNLQVLLSYYNMGVQQEYLKRVCFKILIIKGQRC